MKKIAPLIVCLLLIFNSFGFAPQTFAQESSGGLIDASWTIVIGTDVLEKTAGDDLKQYLSSKYDVTVKGPVQAADYEGTSKAIYIGTTKDNSKIKQEHEARPFQLNTAEIESYYFVTRSDNLWIVGQSAKGAMNGTFRFEDKETRSIINLDEKGNPAFQNRIGGNTFVQNPPSDWSEEDQASYYAHHYINVVWNEKYTEAAPPISPELRQKYGLGLMQEVKLPKVSSSWFTEHPESTWITGNGNDSKVVDPFTEAGYQAYYDAFKKALLDNPDITVLYTLFGDYSLIPNKDYYNRTVDPKDFTSTWKGSYRINSNNETEYYNHSKFDTMVKISEAMKKAVDDVMAADPNRVKATPTAWLWHGFFGDTETQQEEEFMLNMKAKDIGVFYNESGNGDDWAYRLDNFKTLQGQPFTLKTDGQGNSAFGDDFYVLTSAGGTCESLESAVAVPLPEVAAYKMKKLYEGGVKNFALWWGSSEGWLYNANMEVIKEMIWNPNAYDTDTTDPFAVGSLIYNIAIRDFGPTYGPQIIEFWKSMDEALVTTAPIYGDAYVENYPDPNWRWGMQIFSWYQRLGTFTNPGFWAGYKVPLLPSLVADQKNFGVVYGWGPKQQALDNFANVLTNMDAAIQSAINVENAKGISAELKDKVAGMRKYADLVRVLVRSEYNFMRSTKVITDNNLKYDPTTDVIDPAKYNTESLKNQMRPIIEDEIENANYIIQLMNEFPDNFNIGSNFEGVVAKQGSPEHEIAVEESRIANMELWLNDLYDVAQGRPAYSSTNENASTTAAKAVDGDSKTRWSSSYQDDNWFYVDLGVKQNINYISFKWDGAYAKEYNILVSDDGVNWKNVYATKEGTGGNETIVLPKGTSGKYVKFQGVKRGSMWGYSFYDFKVYGNSSTAPVIPSSPSETNLALNKPVTASSEDSGNVGSKLTDGIATTRWGSISAEKQWVYVDLGEEQSFDKIRINWEGSYAKKYDIQLSNDKEEWTTVKSITDGKAGIIDTPMPENTKARYVKVLINERAFSYWGASIYELEVIKDPVKDTVAPTAPNNLTAAKNPEGNISLNWGAATDNQAVAGYIVYRNGQEAIITQDTTFVDKDADPTGTNKYTVKAFDLEVNLSAASNEAEVKLVDDQAPSVPGHVRAQAIGKTSIDLVWDAASDDIGVVKYEVYRDGTKVATPMTASYQDKDLLQGTVYKYTVKAVDAAGNVSAASEEISVTTDKDLYPPAKGDLFDIANGRPVQASTSENSTNAPEKAVDGNVATRWSSAYSDDNWFQVDLGVKQSIHSIRINWSSAFAKEYKLLVSDNGTDWKEVYATNASKGGEEYITLPIGSSGKYVKFQGIKRSTSWGYSFWDFSVYSYFSSAPRLVPVEANLSLNKGVTASSYDKSEANRDPKYANDGNPATRWASEHTDNQSITIDLGSVQSIDKVRLNWESAYGKEYEIQIADTLEGEWTRVAQITNGAKGIKEIQLPTGTSARYVKMQGIKRGTMYGYSLYEFEVIKNDSQEPSIPTHAAGVVNENSHVTLNWDASTDDSGVAGYIVYRDGKELICTQDTTFIDEYTEPGKTYVYTIKAYDGAVNLSAPSGEVSVATPDNQGPSDTVAPTAPANVTAEITGSNAITLNWDESTDDTGVTGYAIYRNGMKLRDVTGTTFTNTNVSAGTNNKYTIKAYDAAGNESAASRQIAITITTNDVANAFLSRTYGNDQYTHELGYRLFVPDNYDPSKSYPLVLFLHGSGERGTDNTAQLTAYKGATVWAEPGNQVKNEAFVLAPQLPEGERWTDIEQYGGSYDFDSLPITEELLMVKAILDQVQEEYSIDANRLYSTGLSNGGQGTWNLNLHYPDLFAALAPVCGVADPTKAYLIASKPIWAFMGDADPVVPVAAVRDMIAALKTAGGDPRYTEYPDVQHDSWVQAYNTQELIDWMFAQTKENDTQVPNPPGDDDQNDDGGTPGDNSGNPGDNSGTPDENGGTPGDNSGTPDENGGTPGDNSGAPDENGGTPNNNNNTGNNHNTDNSTIVTTKDNILPKTGSLVDHRLLVALGGLLLLGGIMAVYITRRKSYLTKE